MRTKNILREYSRIQILLFFLVKKRKVRYTLDHFLSSHKFTLKNRYKNVPDILDYKIPNLREDTGFKLQIR